MEILNVFLHGLNTVSCLIDIMVTARPDLAKKTPASHENGRRGCFAVSPCKVLAARVASRVASRVFLSSSTESASPSLNSMLR